MSQPPMSSPMNSTRTASIGRCSCRFSRFCADTWTWCGSMPERTSASRNWSGSRCGTCRRTPKPTQHSRKRGDGLTLGHAGKPLELVVQGHVVHVPCAARGAARFTFGELCEQPLGAVDYLRISREFHTILLEHIPIMDYDQRNAAKRFIALVDTLYDNAVKLIASAAAQARAFMWQRRLRGAGVQADSIASDRNGVGEPTSPCRTAGAPPPRRTRRHRGIVET